MDCALCAAEPECVLCTGRGDGPDELMARRGWCVISVGGEVPIDPPFAYTTGNHGSGLPELLVFGQHPRVAGHLLERITDGLRSGGLPPLPGAVVPDQLGADGEFAVRLGAVHRRWAEFHALFAFDWYGSDDGIEFLQVVVPDLSGRFWNEPGYDPVTDQLQPDLSQPDWPWRRPLIVPVEPSDGDLVALVPIISHGESTGRREAVAADWVGEHQARLAQPPVAADWISTGTIVEVERDPVPVDDRLPPGHVLTRVVGESSDAPMVWRYHVHSDEDEDRFLTALEEVGSIPGSTLSVTPWTIHVSAPPRLCARVRSTMRRLQRDGLAREVEPYHCGPMPPPDWLPRVGGRGA